MIQLDVFHILSFQKLDTVRTHIIAAQTTVQTAHTCNTTYATDKRTKMSKAAMIHPIDQYSKGPEVTVMSHCFTYAFCSLQLL